METFLDYKVSKVYYPFVTIVFLVAVAGFRSSLIIEQSYLKPPALTGGNSDNMKGELWQTPSAT